jgi:uncharacterized protein (TIGR02246 family)
MDRERLNAWLRGYEAAWRTPGTAGLASLFAPDATYCTAPFEPPYRGLEQIAEMWEAGRDGPDEAFTLSTQVVAVEGSTGVVRVEARYAGPPPRHYRDLWIVRLDDDGLCTEFEEWPFWPAGTPGTFTPGPG